MRHIEIKNLIESYTKKLTKSKSSNAMKNLKLPKLIQNHSYHNLIIRKIEKLRALNSRNKYNSGEIKVKANLSNLFCIHKINNDYFKKPTKIKNIQNKNNNHNNNNSNSSLNSFTYNSQSKTTVSNLVNNISNNNINNNNSNINTNNNSNVNKVKIIKIKQSENGKKTPEENNKLNSECGFIKKKYFINKSNFNKDIFNLINADNNYIFFSKIAKTPRNKELDEILSKESEKNEV